MKKTKKITDFFDIYKIENALHLSVPLAGESVRAGFPSPAEDFIDKSIDLNKELITHPSATFFIRVQGDSMTEADIVEDDVLIVDRALEPKNGDIIIAVIDGEFTLKRLIKKENKIILKPENINYQPIEITEEMDFFVWGTVTTIIRKIR